METIRRIVSIRKAPIVLVLCILFAVLFAKLAYAKEHGLGCLPEKVMPSWLKPSPPIKLLREFDDSCDNSEHLPPVGEQGARNSCVAWALGYYYKTYQEWEEHHWDVTMQSHQFSPAFIYNQINGGTDNGSFMSDAAKLLCDLGCASFADMPYNESNFTDMPEESDYYSGTFFRCRDAYDVNLFESGLTNLKNHLQNGHVAVIGISIYDNFWNIEHHNNTYCRSEVSGESRGGHAVTLCGFDDNRSTSDGVGAFRLVNSMGTDWGDSGYFWMSYQAILDSTTSNGHAVYLIDTTNYSPTLIARFHVWQMDRYAILYQFGIGDHDNPIWSKDFFNWLWMPGAALPYPETNIIVDLSDGASLLSQSSPNQIYMRCHDIHPGNLYDGYIEFLQVEELNTHISVTSSDPPVHIPDSGGVFTYADLEITLDIIPPSTITDLNVVANNQYLLTASFTASGDDGIEGIGFHSLRYSTSPITSSNFNTATAAFVDEPYYGGTLVNRAFSVPFANTTYYIAMKACDESGNCSAISNVAMATTPPLVQEDTSLIVAAEYFFDNDPGLGNGFGISVTPGHEPSLTISNPNMDFLGLGFHRLYLRYRTMNGVWSAAEGRPFFVTAPLSEGGRVLAAAEHFFDTDPGVGQGSPVEFADSTEAVITFTIDPLTEPLGFHRLYLRYRTANGVWSMAEGRPFFVTSETPVPSFIAGGEVFADNDPGQGQGVAIIPDDGIFNEPEEVMHQYLSAGSWAVGSHALYARVRDSRGLWSPVAGDSFMVLVASPSQLVAVWNGLNQQIQLIWNQVPGATQYHVYYDSMATGQFANYIMVTPPDSSLTIDVIAGEYKKFFLVTAIVPDTRLGMKPGGDLDSVSAHSSKLINKNQ